MALTMLCPGCGIKVSLDDTHCGTCGESFYDESPEPANQRDAVRRSGRMQAGRGRAMQRWEYLFIQPQAERNHYLPRYINGQELRAWKRGPDIHEYVHQLGDEGWELIADPVDQQWYYVLKRPRR